jgi:hypothetical protein
VGDHRCGKNTWFGELAEDGYPLAFVRSCETFENGGSMPIELKLECKAADSLHQRGPLEVAGAQERLAVDVKNDRICTVNGHFPRILGAVVVLLQIEHDETVILPGFLFAHGFAAQAKPSA